MIKEMETVFTNFQVDLPIMVHSKMTTIMDLEQRQNQDWLKDQLHVGNMSMTN